MAKSNLIVALGLGKPKGGGDSAPPSYKSAPAPDPSQGGDPTSTEMATDPMEGIEGTGGAGAITPEEVDYSDNDLCETCANMGADGMCTKYNFPVDKTGHCEAGYSPMGGGGDMTGMEGMDDTKIPPNV